MREIKFRAWTGERMIHIDALGLTEAGRGAGYGIWVSIPFQPSVHVMQFTGLRDRNQKEIYEGDILSFVPIDSKKFNNPYKPFVVFWNEKEARFSDWAPRDTVEVIGNIYENPELLEHKGGQV